MTNALKIEIIGDPSKLTKATQTAERDLSKLSASADKAGKHMHDVGTRTQAGLGKMQSGLGSMASTLGGATTNMGGAVQGLTGQIGSAVSMLGPWGMAIGATVGGLGLLTGGLFALGQKSTDLGVSIGRLQRLTGGTSEEMSVFAYMAQQTGVDVDGLGRSLGIFSKNLNNGKLEKLGIEARDAAGNLRPTVDILGDISETFLDMEDGPEKTALAMEIFGKSGAAMIPMLNGGREAIASYAEEAEKFGLVMGDEQVAAAKKSKGAQRDLQAAWTGLQVQLGNHLMPVLTSVTQWLADHMAPIIQAITPAIEWLKQAFTDVGGALEEGGFEKAMDKIGEKFGELWQMLSPHLERLLDSIGQWVETTGKPWLMDKFGEWAWAAIQWVFEMNWQVIGQLGQWLIDLGAWIVNTGLPWIGEKFMQLATAALSWVVETIVQTPTRLAELAGVIFGWLSRQIVEMPGRVVALAENFLGWINTAITEAPGRLWDFALAVGDFLLGLPTQILEWTANAASWLLDVGGQVIEGLKDGMWNAISNIGEWLGGLKDSFMNKFKETFGIASPAKEMMPLGQFMAEGLNVGFASSMQTFGQDSMQTILDRYRQFGDVIKAEDGSWLVLQQMADGSRRNNTGLANELNSDLARRMVSMDQTRGSNPMHADVHMDGQKVGSIVWRHIEQRESVYS